MQPLKLTKRAWLLLLLGVTAFYLYGLGRLPLVGPDEPRYAQVAREMFLRHDPITPTLGGHPWFEKPALLYWMMMGSFRLFGVSEWSARLGPALAGLLTIGALGWIAYLVERRQQSEFENFSFFSTLVISSSGGLIVFSRGASFDIVLTMTITLALCLFLASEISEKGRYWLLAGFYCFIGMSLLAKGLVGIVLPFGVVTAFYLLLRKLPDRKVFVSLLWGVPLAVGVAAVWYGPVIARHGWVFIDQFFIQHHFARYLSNKYQHRQPLYYYGPVMLMLSLPWTLFLVEAAIKVKEWSWTSVEPANKTRVFALAWCLVPLIFFSFSGSKLPAYILPALPAAALLSGERLNRFVSGSPGSLTMRLTSALVVLLSVAGIIYARQSHQLTLSSALAILAPVALLGALSLIFSRRRRLAVLLLALIPFVGSVLTLSLAVDRFASPQSVRDLFKQADARGYAAAPVFMFSRIERTSEFYAAGRVAYGPDGEPHKFETGDEVAAEARRVKAPLLIVAPLGSAGRLQNLPGIQTLTIADNGRIALMAVTAK